MKAKPTRPARKPARTPAEKSASKSASDVTPAVRPERAAGRGSGRPFQGKDDPRNGRGPAPGTPNVGRPRKEVRLLYRDVMVREGIEAARAILLGEPDRSGNVPTFDQRLAWFREIAALGFNTKLELAKIEAAAGAANLQNGVQIIMQGAPAGNLQPIE